MGSAALVLIVPRNLGFVSGDDWVLRHGSDHSSAQPAAMPDGRRRRRRTLARVRSAKKGGQFAMAGRAAASTL